MKQIHSRGQQAGFTVLELVVVAALLLLGIVVSLLVAHPKDYAAQDRNAERTTEVAQLMQVLNRYVADTGTLPPAITDAEQTIGNNEGEVDLCGLFVPTYIKDLPLDPQAGGVLSSTDICLNEQEPVLYSTGYTIKRDVNDTIVIAAPYAELNDRVELRRTFRR
jgi:type II secretory pathway pseudopilin PulG